MSKSKAYSRQYKSKVEVYFNQEDKYYCVFNNGKHIGDMVSGPFDPSRMKLLMSQKASSGRNSELRREAKKKRELILASRKREYKDRCKSAGKTIFDKKTQKLTFVYGHGHGR